MINEFEVNSERTSYCRDASVRISDDLFRQQVKRAFSFAERPCEEILIIAKYSLERMHSYINAEQEPKPTKQGIPPAYWPASGDLRVEKLSARYSLVRITLVPEIRVRPC
jgi:hypothetical protein